MFRYTHSEKEIDKLAFMICFTDEPNTYTDEDSTWAIGQIVAGELNERFHANLHEWDKQAYESQWLQSVEGLLRGDQKAVLITYFVNQRESSNLEWWALYRDGDTVHIQNHSPWYDSFDREFSVAEASSFLHDRVTVDADGNRISEWDVPLREIELFFSQVKQRKK